MVLVNLFLSFLRIGLFAFGGAYSFLPLLEKEIVEKYHWLTKEEFLDVLGMVKILPGAISIKYATYTGYKIGGPAGLIVANLGNIFAPCVLVFFSSAFYSRYKNLPSVQHAFGMIQLAVFSMIVAVAFQLIDIVQLLQLRNLFFVVLFFIIFIYTKIHPALIILCAAILGVVLK